MYIHNKEENKAVLGVMLVITVIAYAISKAFFLERARGVEPLWY